MPAEKEVSVAPLPVSWRSSAPNVRFGNLDPALSGRTGAGVAVVSSSISVSKKLNVFVV